MANSGQAALRAVIQGLRFLPYSNSTLLRILRAFSFQEQMGKESKDHSLDFWYEPGWNMVILIFALIFLARIKAYGHI